MEDKTNVPSIIGFVISLIGFFVFPLLLGIVGLIFSGVGMDTIKYEKHGLATAGLVISFVNIVWGMIKIALYGFTF